MKMKQTETPHTQTPRYLEARGGRKTATVRVRIEEKEGPFTVNGKDLKAYFKTPREQTIAYAPIKLLDLAAHVSGTCHIRGSGLSAQAQAVRHGLSRALAQLNPEFRKKLKRAGFLTRDARSVERKKYGLKKARRAPQWSKR